MVRPSCGCALGKKCGSATHTAVCKLCICLALVWPSYAQRTSNALRDWWNNADEAFAHISYNKHLKSRYVLWKGWQERWLGDFAHLLTRDSRVVDYGIGACLLGEVLLRSHNISHYIGLDVSDRQLSECQKNLESKGFSSTRYTLMRVDALPDLSSFRPTHFISQAVIQHFPSRQYFLDFAARINTCPTLRAVMLQPRTYLPGKNQTTGRPLEYGAMSQKEVTLALMLDMDDVPRALPAFTLVRTFGPVAPIGYVFYTLVRMSPACR